MTGIPTRLCLQEFVIVHGDVDGSLKGTFALTFGLRPPAAASYFPKNHSKVSVDSDRNRPCPKIQLRFSSSTPTMKEGGTRICAQRRTDGRVATLTEWANRMT